MSECTRGISKVRIITPQCVDKMLPNNTLFETRIQQLLDGLFFVEKGLGVHVQHILKMSRVYTLAEMLSKIFGKRELVDLNYDYCSSLYIL